jgi:hypothetical protein
LIDYLTQTSVECAFLSKTTMSIRAKLQSAACEASDISVSTAKNDAWLCSLKGENHGAEGIEMRRFRS